MFTVLPIGLAVMAVAAFVMASRASTIVPGLTPISLQQSISDYHAHPSALRNDIRGPGPLPAAAPNIKGFVRPAAGVYKYHTTGADWVQFEGNKYVRHFPATTYGTVLHGSGCVWELWLKSAAQYTDGHRQCSAPGAEVCLAHFGTVQFAGLAKSLTHVCEPPMLMVGGADVRPGGHQETTCIAQGQDVAKIVMKFIGAENVVVAGQSVPAYHVKLISYLSGSSVRGTAEADVWFDEHTGMYLKMIRTQNTSVSSSGDWGEYDVRITYQLASLTPLT